MNIYDCRFLKENDSVTHLRQYGKSEDDIVRFWTEWWPKHYDGKDPSTGKFVDCKQVESDVNDVGQFDGPDLYDSDAKNLET